jgi:hypothetical protein
MDFLAFMERKGLSMNSQKITIGSDPDPDETSSHLCKIQFNSILPPIASLQSNLFLGCISQNFVDISHFPIYGACPVYLFTHDVCEMLKDLVLHKTHILLANKTDRTLQLLCHRSPKLQQTGSNFLGIS